MICVRCGYEFASSPTGCPLCSGGPWQAWELMFAPHALDDLRAQVTGWIGQLPFPTMIEWIGSPEGLRIRLFLPAQIAGAEAVTRAWAAMTGQHSRWRKLGMLEIKGTGYAFHSSNRLPSIIVSAKDSDPILAIGSRLISAEARLRLWLLGNEGELQERLRTLSAYSYGTEGGVQNNAPNPWGFQLELLRGWRGRHFLPDRAIQ